MIGLWYFVIYGIIILILWAFKRTREFLKSNIPELIYSISSYFFLLADIKSSSPDILFGNYKWKELNIALISLGVIIMFIGFYLSHKRNKIISNAESVKEKYEKEKTKNDQIKKEYLILCSNYIKDIFEDFYKSSNGNSRVSLYKHKDSHFVLLGRYSDNPQYSKIGSDTYRDDEGFIAFGWEQGQFEVHSIPKWKKGGASYKSFMKQNCTISDERLNSLKMKSCSFYVYRFDSDTTRPFGIIVFEKMEDGQIDQTMIQNIFTSHKQQIINILKSMNTLHKN